MCRCCARRTRMRASCRSTPPPPKPWTASKASSPRADVPGEDGFGVFVNDQPIMARGKVRYVGEAVAAVAAEDPLTAKRARGGDQGRLRAAAGGVRRRRGDAARRAGAARLRARQRHQAHPDPRRRRREGLRRLRSGGGGNLFDAGDRARLSRAGSGPGLRRSRRRRDGRLARARTSPITATCWRASSPSRSAKCASS